MSDMKVTPLAGQAALRALPEGAFCLFVLKVLESDFTF